MIFINMKELTLISITVTVIFFIFLLLKPIPQPENYHRFADKRTLLGIPNCLDVLSNIPFVMVGLAGMTFVMILIIGGGDVIMLMPLLIFFAGVFLTGFGSGWYHLNPNNDSLVWDRLPMTIAFAGFFSFVVSEQITVMAGAVLLLPLLILGSCSVLYWKWTEDRGRGDLRLYGIVQFLPVLLIPLILVMYDGPKYLRFYIVALLICYLFAKLFEFLDDVVYSLGNIVSGHTLKHLFAAVGTFYPLLMIYSRWMAG